MLKLIVSQILEGRLEIHKLPAGKVISLALLQKQDPHIRQDPLIVKCTTHNQHSPSSTPVRFCVSRRLPNDLQ